MFKLPFLKKKYDLDLSIPEAMQMKDIIAPSSINITSSDLQFDERFAKSFFIFSYPRYLSTGWFSPIINLDVPIDISFFIHPAETTVILKQLRQKITAVQAELIERQEKGLIRAPELEIAHQDMEALRDRLQTAQERMFHFALYLTIYADEKKELRSIETTLRSILEGRLIYIKPALHKQKEAFVSTSPYGLDMLLIHNPMNTSPLSSCFPFISFDLSSNQGILYGINQHNNSLILFDRFNMENYNSVLFGRSGCGKSFAVKLEVLRSLMLGINTIIIDPENEYQFLADATGGSFFNISLSSENHLNPFDLPIPRKDENPDDVLRSNIINLVGLMRIMLGGLTPEEDAIMDQALSATYAAKDITTESNPLEWKDNVPLMSDLQAVLETMEGAESLVRRLKKFTTGSYASFFNQRSNVSMENKLVVFGIRNMEEELKQMAMFIIMRYVWKTITSELKKRILIVDEAWWLMQTEDGASFLFGLTKRARKYWLGVTTITQDVNDFMKSEYGQPIISNTSIQILMKQSPATIDIVQEVFNLTTEERLRLLESSVGEGLFFAGTKHVAIRIVASYAEEQIITTSPEEVVKIKKAKEELNVPLPKLP
ncbi:MAG: ATP-binding protein [Candidatus Pacebacteria bacterium]|nr:ATP-binding protein [Candidatus Paceibacterota bacterium]